MPDFSITVAEAGRRGGTARARNMSPEDRKQAAADAYLAGAVRTVIRRWADLTDDERAALSEVMAGGWR